MKEICHKIRAELLTVEKKVGELKAAAQICELIDRHDVPAEAPAADRGEMIANVQLAYRHLEDARMRIGKVIQAYEGGKSCYPQ